MPCGVFLPSCYLVFGHKSVYRYLFANIAWHHSNYPISDADSEKCRVGHRKVWVANKVQGRSHSLAMGSLRPNYSEAEKFLQRLVGNLVSSDDKC